MFTRQIVENYKVDNRLGLRNSSSLMEPPFPTYTYVIWNSFSVLLLICRCVTNVMKIIMTILDSAVVLIL